MFNEKKLEEHYASLPSEALHHIRAELKWELEECGVHTETQLDYVEKVLSLRGESLEVRTERKVLFLCKCGQSRIVDVSLPENKIKMFIFEQYNTPCSKCRAVNNYTWKYMD